MLLKFLRKPQYRSWDDLNDEQRLNIPRLVCCTFRQYILLLLRKGEHRPFCRPGQYRLDVCLLQLGDCLQKEFEDYLYWYVGWIFGFLDYWIARLLDSKYLKIQQSN